MRAKGAGDVEGPRAEGACAWYGLAGGGSWASLVGLGRYLLVQDAREHVSNSIKRKVVRTPFDWTKHLSLIHI